jgi:hypothetical protein
MKFLVTFFAIINQCLAASCGQDTLIIRTDTTLTSKEKEFAFNGNISSLLNFKAQTYNSIILGGRINLIKSKTSGNKKSRKEFIADYSTTKIIDSIWLKTSDNINYTYNLSLQKGKIEYAFTYSLKSQLTDSYLFENLESKMVGQMGFPMILGAGLGLNVITKKQNFINLSPLTIDYTILTRQLKQDRGEFKRLSEKTDFRQRIGITVRSNLNVTISNHLLWKSNSSFFAKGFRNSDMNFDMVNRWIFTIYKNFNLSLENQLSFDPLISEKMQMRSELLLGVRFAKLKTQ